MKKTKGDKTGPPKSNTNRPKDGRGAGRGNNSNQSSGTGKRTGGKRNKC